MTVRKTDTNRKAKATKSKSSINNNQQNATESTLSIDSYLNNEQKIDETHKTQSTNIPVQKTQMGGVESYLGSVTLEWFAQHVKFAANLSLLQENERENQGDGRGSGFAHRHSHKNNINNSNVEIDAENIDDIKQRPLDWSRQATLVQYLASRKHHKFPPVLVVISQSWVEDKQAANWDKNGQAIQSSADFIPLDLDNGNLQNENLKNGNLGLLNVSPDKITIYALDGQHRLMGVQGLMQLLAEGKIPRYKKEKNQTSNDAFLDINDLINQHNLSSEYLKSLPQEKIGIEFIPAVVPGESYEEARRRIRSIFVHVNLMAVPLTKGQLTQLDEDDGFSIVARKIAVTHPLFEQREDRKDRVNWNSATVAANSTVLTTLQALKDMSEKYLGQKYPHWKREKGLISMRPEDEELNAAISLFSQLFDYLIDLPSYKILEEMQTPALRRFSFEKDGGEGNILFRPVGQVAFAQALGILVFKKGLTLEIIFKKLRKFDKQGGFNGIEFPKSIWYGVLYDPNRKRIVVSGKDLAAKLLVYILGGVKDTMERAQIRNALAKARTFENKTINFDGDFVEPKEVGLPSLL